MRAIAVGFDDPHTRFRLAHSTPKEDIVRMTGSRLTLVGVFLLSLLTAVVFRGAARTMAAGPHGYAVGGGKVDGRPDGSGIQQFSFSAHDGPEGPTGHGRMEFPPSGYYPLGFTVQGPVTCYQSLGPKTARFVIQITKGKGDIPAGATGFSFYVEDNGDPGNAGPDRMGSGWVFGAVPQGNKCPFQGGNTPVLSGNVVVDNP